MKLTVIGSGDAFGSGGRLQTCFHVAASSGNFLIDCGTTSVIGFNGLGLDPNRVGTILISHLHGDHFGGLVWWMLHAKHVSRRTAPLDVVGPRGIEERYRQACEVLFPTSSADPENFKLQFHEIEAGTPMRIAGLTVSAFLVRHPSGAPSHALRIEVDGRVLAFSGDTEWVDALIEVSADANLYISECYGYEPPTKFHMSWRVIEENMPRITARQVMLTHMGPAMLEQVRRVENDRILIAEDGLVLHIE
ncbi:MAG: MBL fold metallo-hydrolase [Hyphomicrobiaceae bacterium]